MNDSKDILQKYAETLGFKYIEPLSDNPNFSKYYVCLTEAMKNSVNGKFGTPCVITLSDNGNPYRLERSELALIFRKLKGF